MICPGCGNKIDNYIEYCEYCGFPIAPKSSRRKSQEQNSSNTQVEQKQERQKPTEIKKEAPHPSVKNHFSSDLPPKNKPSVDRSEKVTKGKNAVSKKQKTNPLKIIIPIVIALVLLIIAAIIGIKAKQKNERLEVSYNRDTNVSETTEAEYLSESIEEAQNEPEISTTFPELTIPETTEATIVLEPIVFSGIGDMVIQDIEIPMGLYKVTLHHSGARNFIVHSYDCEGNRADSLANEIGEYEGSIVFTDNIDGGILEVKADGNWSIVFESIIDSGTSNLVGEGDKVSPWFTLQSGALIVSFTNSGNRNFIVHLYDEAGNRYSTLVNEIGDYEGSVVFNKGKSGVKYCVEVISDGNWTVDFGIESGITYLQ